MKKEEKYRLCFGIAYSLAAVVCILMACVMASEKQADFFEKVVSLTLMSIVNIAMSAYYWYNFINSEEV